MFLVDIDEVTSFFTNASLLKPVNLVNILLTGLVDALDEVEWSVERVPLVGSIRRTFRHVQPLHLEDYALQKAIRSGSSVTRSPSRKTPNTHLAAKTAAAGDGALPNRQAKNVDWTHRIDNKRMPEIGKV